LSHRPGLVERRGRGGLEDRKRSARRWRDRGLPEGCPAAGRGHVRLDVRRTAARSGRAACCRHRAGGSLMAAITLIEALTQAMAWELKHDPSVLILGEDVGVNGGVFR